MSTGLNAWKQHVPHWFAAWALVLALLVGYWAGSFARPQQDRWHFEKSIVLPGSDHQWLIRVDKQSGKTEVLLGQTGWKELPLTPLMPNAR